jgi:hypothetical protein
MKSTQPGLTIPLASVKPLENLKGYRDLCLAEARAALEGASIPRTDCPPCGLRLRPWGHVEGFEYGRCGACGGFFLSHVSSPPRWAALLRNVAEYKLAPDGFHAPITTSRNESVYVPRLDWIRHTLRLHGLAQPRILEVAAPPSAFTEVLAQSGAFESVTPMPEEGGWEGIEANAGAAVLLESLDRASDPGGLLSAVVQRLDRGGLVFITGIVASGFDVATLGLRNRYIYPPDRTNCFSIESLVKLAERCGLEPVEVSTPGALDVEIVDGHRRENPDIVLSPFERQLLDAGPERREAFQTFLQENLMSSFARIVGRVL